MMDDIEAIRQLKARYFRLMDTKDWDALMGVFTDDVVVDVTSEGAGLRRGVDQFVPFLRRLLDGAVTVHHGHMPEIMLTSSTTAAGVWPMEDRVWWPPGGPVSFMHGYRHYHETYEKHDRWRISSLTLTRLRRDVE